MIDQFKKNEILELVAQPLLLWISLQIFSELDLNRTLNQKINKTMLYQLIISQWFEREQTKLRNRKDKNLNLNQFQPFSSSLAWSMYIQLKSEATIPYETRFDEFERIRPIRFIKKEKKDLDQVAIFAFIHKSFQEYLVAKKIFEDITDVIE